MEVKEMKELIAAVSSANVDEFEYNNEEFSIRIAKKKAKIATVDASVAGVPVQSAAIMPEQNEEQPEELLYGDEIKAPLVGTFYEHHQKELSHLYLSVTKSKKDR